MSAAAPSLVVRSRAFARPHSLVSAWQLVSTLALYLLALSLLGALPWATAALLVPLLAGLLVRIFVLQHDCSHASFFPRRRTCDRVGQALSCITGVGFRPWRAEHDWHHAWQGRLDLRGIDRMNSPMTVAEAIADPEAARKRAAFISPLTVAVFGAISLAVSRKRPPGFFVFRKTWRWPVPDAPELLASLRWTLVGHAAVHLAYLATLGPARWAALLLPAHVLGAMAGALLFWVQHNFEHTLHAEPEHWSFEAVGLRGSSHLRLPWPLRWFTADIGLHHVHHLNSRIPNYRLEEARRALPELAEVESLGLTDLRRCFTHVFWDPDQGQMVDLAAVRAATIRARPSGEATRDQPGGHRTLEAS